MLNQEFFWHNQIGKLFVRNLILINNRIERGSENKYFPLIVWISSSLTTRTPPQYEDILFLIKYRYTNNNFLRHFGMVLGIGIRGLVQFIGFEAIAVFGFFILLNLEKLLQCFVCSQNAYFSMKHTFFFINNSFLTLAPKNCFAIV